ncbi:MAG: hypothetical protein R2882_03095 [Gemmatimonadales bacterium]
MANSKIVVGKPARRREADPSQVGTLLLTTGALLLAAGMVDIGLAIGPANLGDAPQRFGTAAGVASGWPILAIGAVALQLGSVAKGSRPAALAATAVHAIGAVVLLALVAALVVDFRTVKELAGPGAEAISRGFARALASGLMFIGLHVAGLMSRNLLRDRDD